MKTISIFNHVLGPVMRGPSSSHTAGAFHVGSLARSILGGTPRRAVLTFDPAGSFAVTYRPQGADRGFAMGLMNKPLTDESFFTALDDARATGIDLQFTVRPLPHADHPNTVTLELTADGGTAVSLTARSIGGGEVELTEIDGIPILFNGSAYEVLIDIGDEHAGAAAELLVADGGCFSQAKSCWANGRVALTARRQTPLSPAFLSKLRSFDELARLWQAAPVYFLQPGAPLFRSAAEMVQAAERERLSLGHVALAYESQLLNLAPENVLAEMLRRYDIMERSVARGLARDFNGLQLLSPCAGKMFDAEAAGGVLTRAPHTRAAARALAVMHVDGAMGVVCAAPTGGSAGVIPGTLVTLAEERRLTREEIGLALLAAGAIGVIVAQRATFAAEVAGCQVEIGASGAMAAAAVVQGVGGSAQQACDAAAIALQNTMGSVCDLVHGMVEIPCHTRNAAAAAAALVNADMILGGYENPIPLDDTIDAVYAVGRALPVELRCTSEGGLAVTPAAQRLVPRNCSGCSP